MNNEKYSKQNHDIKKYMEIANNLEKVTFTYIQKLKEK